MDSERLSSSYSSSVSGQRSSGSKTVTSSSSSSSSSSGSSSQSSSTSISEESVARSGGTKTTSYRLSGGSGNTIPENSGKTTSTSSWNRTSTVTRYRPDGTVESSVSTHSGGPGSIGSTDFGPLDEEDYDYDEEIEEPLPSQQSTQSRRVRQVGEVIHGRNHQKRIRSRRQDNQAQELDRELNCGATQCTVIKCSAGPITSNNRVVFKLRARIWAQTISEVNFNLMFVICGRNKNDLFHPNRLIGKIWPFLPKWWWM